MQRHHDPFLIWLGMFTLCGVLLALGLHLSKIVVQSPSLAVAYGFTYVVPLAVSLFGRRKKADVEPFLAGYWKLCLLGSGLLISIGLLRRFEWL
jgi:hypothetical protein